MLKGRGLNLRRAILPYFLGQLLLMPVLTMERRLNLAMQTIVCRRAAESEIGDRNRKSEIGNRKSNGALSQAISLDPSTLDVRTIAPACGSGAIVTLTAIVLIPVGILTLFRAPALFGVRATGVQSHPADLYHGPRAPVSTFPRTIYISNHTSTLDLFVLVSLGLPNCRFFLSGFLKKIIPLGVISGMMGTFFTAPQDRPPSGRDLPARRAHPSPHWRIRVSEP